MTQDKIIQQIDITCNIAFLDICNSPAIFYLLCCTGQQYPNYPCFGSPESGYTQHSSICRAALNSGIKCGQQFFVFFVGDSCAFPGSNLNGSISFPFDEWSKAYQIKNVRNVLTEHKKLVASMHEWEISDAEKTKLVRELEFRLGQSRLENESLLEKIKALEREKDNLRKQQILIKKIGDDAKNELAMLKKFPFDEHETVKKERALLQRELKLSRKEKLRLESQVCECRSKLAEHERSARERGEAKTRKRKTRELAKELSVQGTVARLEKCVGDARAILGEYEKEKETCEKEAENSNAVSDMKEIFKILSGLKIDLQQNRDDLDEMFAPLLPSAPIGSNGSLKECGEIESALEMISGLINSRFLDDGNSASVEFTSRLAEFRKLISEHKNNPEFARIEEKSARLLKSVIIDPSEKLEEINKMHKVCVDHENYDALLAEYKKLQENIAEHKEKRNISEIIKTTNSVQQLIDEKILPENKKIRQTVVEMRAETSKLLALPKKVQLDTKGLEEQISLAKKDIVDIEELGPVPKKGEIDLKNQISNLQNERKSAVDEQKKEMEQSESVLTKHIANCRKMKDMNLKQITLQNKLEAMEFKTLRWNEAKEDRKKSLSIFIVQKESIKIYLEQLQSLIAFGVQCLSNMEKQRLALLEENENRLANEYRHNLMALYNSILEDRAIKKKQLSKLNSNLKSLSVQLEEAIDLMDEEAAHAIKAQMDNLPVKERALEKKIEEATLKMEKMEKDEFFANAEKMEKIESRESKEDKTEIKASANAAKKAKKKTKAREQDRAKTKAGDDPEDARRDGKEKSQGGRLEKEDHKAADQKENEKSGSPVSEEKPKQVENDNRYGSKEEGNKEEMNKEDEKKKSEIRVENAVEFKGEKIYKIDKIEKSDKIEKIEKSEKSDEKERKKKESKRNVKKRHKKQDPAAAGTKGEITSNKTSEMEKSQEPFQKEKSSKSVGFFSSFFSKS